MSLKENSNFEIVCIRVISFSGVAFQPDFSCNSCIPSWQLRSMVTSSCRSSSRVKIWFFSISLIIANKALSSFLPHLLWTIPVNFLLLVVL
ncbi:unnamed protein product [Moneuplotes crassus]|uniref:Uncharacterized protein n=1 Tax=Euplotes crassus TaxID=5936 RepID=A0AAD1XW94_EUPCR|nr:unnamed protein product [Moneuplotes crassus]